MPVKVATRMVLDIIQLSQVSFVIGIAMCVWREGGAGAVRVGVVCVCACCARVCGTAWDAEKHSVRRFSTPPCVHSKRLRVFLRKFEELEKRGTFHEHL